MKRYLHAFAMCQSMFCAIPSPFQIWDEEARDKMLLFLPLVGLEIGGIWAVLAWAAAGLPELIRGLILCVWPFLATGFIHLDGYMDVTDAVGSCRDLDKRRAILKDSHVGAFAVIGMGMLLLAQFAFCASAKGEGLSLIFIPAVSRCCSALAVTLLRPMSTSQYAARKIQRGDVVILGIQLGLYLIAGAVLGGWEPPAACLIGYALALRKGYRSLDGMNGDISGYALTIAELCALAAWAVC